MDTLTVNLFAGPGAGKSTNCAAAYTLLKQAGWNVEMAREWVKDAVWEGRSLIHEPLAQTYILGKQSWILQRLQGKVEVVLTDSPLLQSGAVYSDSRALAMVAIEHYNAMTNLNIFVDRSKEFESAGRLQNEEEAQELDARILKMLANYRKPCVFVQDGPGSAEAIVGLILRELESPEEN